MIDISKFKYYIYNRIKIKVSIAILLILFSIIVFELYTRTFRPNYNTFDKNLGWKLKKNFRFLYKQKDFYNENYYVDFETNEYGLRPFGNKKKGKKILILGDSCTADPYASNNDMWYGVLANEFSKNKENYYGYAGGGGGYGTFQNLILLERIKNEIIPDIFILQFHSNDYMNNFYEWEKEYGSIVQYLRRPYFTNYNSFTKNPNFFYPIINTRIFSEIKILNTFIFYLSVVNKKIFSKFTNSKNINIFKDNAHIITLELLIKIRQIYPNTKAYIINCDPNDEKNDKFQELVIKSNFILIPTGDRMKEHILKKEKIFYKDGAHYNPLGNKFLGMEISNYLKKNN
jgi:lysophospholipase L1-like esterase